MACRVFLVADALVGGVSVAGAAGVVDAAVGIVVVVVVVVVVAAAGDDVVGVVYIAAADVDAVVGDEVVEDALA